MKTVAVMVDVVKIQAEPTEAQGVGTKPIDYRGRKLERMSILKRAKAFCTGLLKKREAKSTGKIEPLRKSDISSPSDFKHIEGFSGFSKEGCTAVSPDQTINITPAPLFLPAWTDYLMENASPEASPNQESAHFQTPGTDIDSEFNEEPRYEAVGRGSHFDSDIASMAGNTASELPDINEDSDPNYMTVKKPTSDEVAHMAVAEMKQEENQPVASQPADMTPLGMDTDEEPIYMVIDKSTGKFAHKTVAEIKLAETLAEMLAEIKQATAASRPADTTPHGKLDMGAYTSVVTLASPSFQLRHRYYERSTMIKEKSADHAAEAREKLKAERENAAAVSDAIYKAAAARGEGDG